MVKRLIIAAVGLALVVGVLVVLLTSGAERAAAQPDPGMSIGVSGASVPVGEEFEANIGIYSSTPFWFYSVALELPTGVSFVSGSHQTLVWSECTEWGEGPETQCSTPGGGLEYPWSGLVETVTLRCDSVGTYYLNLAPWDGLHGSILRSSSSYLIPTLIISTIDCAPAAVGGIAELPALAGPPGGSGMGGATHAVLAGAAAGVLAFAVLATLLVRRLRVR